MDMKYNPTYKLQFLENEIKNNKKIYCWMKSSYSNIFGVGDVIINEWLDNTFKNIKSNEIKAYPYLIDDMYYIYSMRSVFSVSDCADKIVLLSKL